MADNHTVYKNGAKEIAFANGCSITFMAKPHHEWIGSSCHIHSSLWRDGENAFAGESDIFKHYLAGQIAWPEGARGLHGAERELIQALRCRELGADDARLGLRQPHLRLPDRRPRRRPSAPRRASPAATSTRTWPSQRYSPLGSTGSRTSSSFPLRSRGTRTSLTPSGSRSSLRDAIAALEEGSMARAALGDDVVDHYLNYARTEQQLFDGVVTDWERKRLFEQG